MLFVMLRLGLESKVIIIENNKYVDHHTKLTDVVDRKAHQCRGIHWQAAR